MTAAEWDDLARLAEAIPPEHRDEWSATWGNYEHARVWGPDEDDAEPLALILGYLDPANGAALARFIAAANPDTILRLIEDNRRLSSVIKGHEAVAAALIAERDALAARTPCDGGCNYGDGPMEDCSRHGRPPAEVWQIVTEVQAQRDALAARLAAVEALADEWDESDETHEWILAVPLRAALTGVPADTLRAVLTEVTADTAEETDR